jgi:general secretion pathway protein F
VLIALQEGFAANWPVATVVLAAMVAGAIALARSARWRLMWDRMMLRTPVIATVVRSGQTATMTRTLAALIRNGVPLLQALQVTSTVLGNRVMAAALQDCANDVREGATLANALGKAKIFPEMALRLAAVGEQTGQLDAMLERAGRIYEAALQQHLQRLTNLLTPVLTLVIGVLVGGLLLSVMGAIVGLNELALR